MCRPPIGWSFVRGKSQIAVVAGRVWSLVKGSFIQRRQSISEKTVIKSGWSLNRVVFHEEFHSTKLSSEGFKNVTYLSHGKCMAKLTHHTKILISNRFFQK